MQSTDVFEHLEQWAAFLMSGLPQAGEIRRAFDAMQLHQRWIERDLERTDRQRPLETALWRDLAARGWYLSSRFPNSHMDHLLRWHAAGDITSLEQYLLEFARSVIPQLRQDLDARYPLRARIFNDAFTAHEQHLYTLSVPVMLAQADGICREILGVQLFSKDPRPPRAPKTAKPISERMLRDPSLAFFSSALFEPLLFGSRLAENTRNTTPEDRAASLNRHGVLHGEDVNYATERNAACCVLLLAYLTDAGEMLVQATQ